MDNDIYLHVSSSGSKHYFPRNNAAHFCIKLNTPLNLIGNWVIGLCELDIQNVDVPTNVSRGCTSLKIECNVCSGIIVNGVQTRVIRVMALKPSVNEVYPVVYYVPL
jgi:hypothetical protein